VLCALQEAGWRVPQVLSVVGFDDIPQAAYTSPPLTTVRQPVAELARTAATLLLDSIEGETEQESSNELRSDAAPLAGSPQDVRKVLLTPTLVVRRSTTSVHLCGIDCDHNVSSG
ncbi:MAG: lacI 4, partial [Chloroflexi bacterium]|nr:lacI 4 [Chloroflexota bacterium]